MSKTTNKEMSKLNKLVRRSALLALAIPAVVGIFASVQGDVFVVGAIAVVYVFFTVLQIEMLQ